MKKSARRSDAGRGQPVLNHMPKAPSAVGPGHWYDGVQYAGLRIITLNRGSRGLDIGDVLQLWRAGATIKTDAARQSVRQAARRAARPRLCLPRVPGTAH
jgi:hypothetical protein